MTSGAAVPPLLRGETNKSIPPSVSLRLVDTGVTVEQMVWFQQAKTLAWLTDAITSLRQQLATAQQADAELRTLRNERAILQAKVDSLMGENATLCPVWNALKVLAACSGEISLTGPTSGSRSSPQHRSTS